MQSTTVQKPTANLQQQPFKESLGVDSNELADFVKLLGWIKDPKSKPIVGKLNPKMCLTCWVIFCDREKQDHLQSGGPFKHKITGTFQSMAAAKREAILGLCRQWKKTEGVSGSPSERVVPLQLSPSLLEHVMSDSQFTKYLPKAAMIPTRPDLDELNKQIVSEKQAVGQKPEVQSVSPPSSKAVSPAKPVVKEGASQGAGVSNRARRQAKQLDKGQTQLDKVLRAQKVTEVKCNPLSGTSSASKNLQPAPGNHAQVSEDKTQATQDQTAILQQDSVAIKNVPQSASPTPGTVLLRPTQTDPQRVEFQNKFQELMMSKMEEILCRVGSLEARLDAKNFLAPFEPVQAAPVDDPPVMTELKAQPDPLVQAGRPVVASGMPLHIEPINQACEPGQDTVSEHSDDDQQQQSGTQHQPPTEQIMTATFGQQPLTQEPAAQVFVDEPILSRLIKTSRLEQTQFAKRRSSKPKPSEQICRTASKAQQQRQPLREVVTIELD